MKEKLVKTIQIIILLSPFLDMVTAFMLQCLNIDFTIGMFFRFLLIILSFGYLVFIYKENDKKYLLLTLGLIFIYLLSFGLIMFINKDFNSLLYELKNAIKTFYFPVLLITFYALFKENKDLITSKHLVILYLIYLLGIFIPDILGIGFDTYEISKTGSIGFFNTANEISAIISILMPFFLLYLFKKHNFFLTIILIAILVYNLLSMGTKGPLLSFAIIIFVIIFMYIIYLAHEKLYKKLTYLVITLFIFILFASFYLPRTAFYQNIKIHLDFLGVDNVLDVFKDKELFDHFVFSSRLKFLGNTFDSYEEAPILSKLFGIGYIENYNTSLESTKMIEMDYFDILFRHGILGFILYMSIYLYFLIKAFKINKKSKNIPYKVSYFLSLFLTIVLAFITGHVLLAPAVSTFVVLLLIKKEEKYA